MRVLLPIRLSPTGGTSAFARKFALGMPYLGHSVVFERGEDYDVLLVPATCPLSYLLDAHRRRKRIVHRLDGVYYPTTVVGWCYWLYNVPLRIIRNAFADAVIYQSYYSLHTCRKFLGAGYHGPYEVLYNGVDTEHFTDQGPRQPLHDSPEQPIFITVSRFRRRDQILPLIEAFRLLRKKYQPHAKLVIIGNFEGAVKGVPRQLRHEAGIVFRGVVTEQNLPNYLRAADVFVFTHTNPPCPNNVLEAISCGLPVAGVADGAMPELVHQGAHGLLIPAQGEGFYTNRTLDIELFAQNMETLWRNKSSFSTACRQHALEHFSLERMIEAYAKILDSFS